MRTDEQQCLSMKTVFGLYNLFSGTQIILVMSLCVCVCSSHSRVVNMFTKHRQFYCQMATNNARLMSAKFAVHISQVFSQRFSYLS